MSSGGESGKTGTLDPGISLSAIHEEEGRPNRRGNEDHTRKPHREPQEHDQGHTHGKPPLPSHARSNGHPRTHVKTLIHELSNAQEQSHAHVHTPTRQHRTKELSPTRRHHTHDHSPSRGHSHSNGHSRKHEHSPTRVKSCSNGHRRTHQHSSNEPSTEHEQPTVQEHTTINEQSAVHEQFSRAQSVTKSLLNLLPRVLPPGLPPRRHGSCGMDANDCEGGGGEEQPKRPTSRGTERWMVAVSATGVIVSGLVLVIVLYPLVTPQPSVTPSPLNNKSPSKPQARVTSFSDYNENYRSDVTPDPPQSLLNGQPNSADTHRQFHNDKHRSNRPHTPRTLHRTPGKDPQYPRPREPSPVLRKFYRMVTRNTKGAMNTTADPCQDFYQYACGNWGIQHPAPRGVTSWSNFEDMTLMIWRHMEDEIKRLISGHNTSLKDANLVVKDLVANYYSACENEMNLVFKGVDPLKAVLQKMDEMYRQAKQDMEPLSAFRHMLHYVHHELAIQSFFSWKVETDNKVEGALAIELRAPNVDALPQGTNLKENKPIVDAYKTYAANILSMVGTYKDSTNKEVEIILRQLETYLSLAGSPLINDTSIAELDTLAPFLDWHAYFNKAFNSIGTFINREERILSLIQDYLAAISKEIIEEIEDHGSERLYIYLRWHVIQYYSQFLHHEARKTILPLLDIITGQDTSALPRFRYRPCIKELEEKFALPTSYLLLESVKHHLPSGTITDTVRNVKYMANSIRNKYIDYINSFEWLKPQAKTVLIDKLQNVKVLVGYPDILDDTKRLEEMLKPIELNKATPLQNQIALNRFNLQRQMRFLRQPELYSEWEILSPMSLLSFYMYRRNTLLVPLGGFRYPLYSSKLPNALTYATLGMFISHELGHAVDFVGRTRDIHGRANASMWDEDTVREFAEKVMCRVKQYSEDYYPVQGLLTIAEVMADDGSIGTAYEAAKDSLHQTTFPVQIVDMMKQLDLTADQLFFVNFAQLFCMTTSPGTPIKGIDHYPPHPTRVVATLSNTPQFHKVFSCPKDSPMNNINEACDIW